MSTEHTDDREEPNGNRATVALVSAQVRGVERLIDAGFKDVQRQLDDQHADYTRLAPTVDSLRDRALYLESRVTKLEDAAVHAEQTADDDRAYRRKDLPLILVGCVAAIGPLTSLVLLFTR